MSDSEAGIPWNSPKLRAILASTLVLPLGVALLSPALPAISDTFGLTDAETSLLVTVYFVPGIVLSPFIGLLADRYGRQAVMFPSLLGFGIAGAAIAAVDSFAVILLLRLLQGTASAGVFILTVTFISDLFEGLQRNAVLGVNAAFLFGGAAAYPSLGGALAAVDWHVPFLAYLLAIPIAVYAYSRLDDPPIVRPRTGPGYLRGAATAMPRREGVALYGATFIIEAVALGAILTAFPFLLAADFGASSVAIGVVITAMMSVTAAVSASNGHLARYWSNSRLVVMGFWCYGIGMLVCWTAPSVAVVGLGGTIIVAGFGMAHPSVDAAIGQLAPPAYRAGALSIRNGVTFFGRAAGPIAFTGLAVVTGYQVLLLATALATLALGAVGLVVTDGQPAFDEDSVPH